MVHGKNNNGKKKPKGNLPSLESLTPFKWSDDKFKVRFKETARGVVDSGARGKVFEKNDPELKRRKAAYKAKFIANQKAKAEKAKAKLMDMTGMTPAQYRAKVKKRK
jgi:hypothetical protein